MRKLIGALLIVSAIAILAAFAGATMLPDLHQKFGSVFCSSGEQLQAFTTGDSENGNTTVYCATQDGKRRDITGTYFIAMFASFLIPLYIGKMLYSSNRTDLINVMTPQQVTLTSDNWLQVNGTAAAFQQQQITSALLQAEKAFQAGLISKEDLEKYRATIQQAQNSWQS
jgi:hypothetical protein